MTVCTLGFVTASLVVLGVAGMQTGASDPEGVVWAPIRAAGVVAPVAAPLTGTAPVTDPLVVEPVAAPPVVAAPARPSVAVPAPEAAHEDPSTCSGNGWQRRRGAAALSSLRPGPASDYPVSFKPAKEGFYGLTRSHEQSIDVYVRSCAAESDALLRHVVAHEMGHALDKTVLTDAQRTAWLSARGISAATSWYGCNRCTDFATPAGDFAEVYAQWRRGASDNRSKLAGAPGPAVLDALAHEFFGA